MRVLHVTEALGGGIQSALANYISGVDEVEHAVYSRARGGQSTHDWGDAAVPHERFEGSLRAFFTRLVAKVRAEQPDVVHLHSSFAGAARAVLPQGTGVVYSPHCYAMERRDVPAPVRWGYAVAEYAFARRRQVTVAVSPREAEISGRLNRRTPAVVALNPSPFGRQARRQRLWATEREVVMVGRISPQKDPGLFAAVASECSDAGCRFVWIGDGEPSDRAALADAGVEVTGWTPPEALRERVAGAALYLHSAAWEGGPVATIEAASLGVPVLARSIPSMDSLGYPLAGETPHEVAETVQRFFDDAAFADEVGETSKQVADAASHAAMADALRSAYARAVAS